jgi:hypothetical protein
MPIGCALDFAADIFLEQTLRLLSLSGRLQAGVNATRTTMTAIRNAARNEDTLGSRASRLRPPARHRNRNEASAMRSKQHGTAASNTKRLRARTSPARERL